MTNDGGGAANDETREQSDRRFRSGKTIDTGKTTPETGRGTYG